MCTTETFTESEQTMSELRAGQGGRTLPGGRGRESDEVHTQQRTQSAKALHAMACGLLENYSGRHG